MTRKTRKAARTTQLTTQQLTAVTGGVTVGTPVIDGVKLTKPTTQLWAVMID